MKRFYVVVVALTLMAFVGSTYAKDKSKKADKKPAVLKGEVVKVDGTNLVLKLKDKEVTVSTNNQTEVMIEDAKSKLSDLKPGQKVIVTPVEGTATRIEVPKPKKKADKPEKA